jgi:RNA recognition motif-containing protein
MLSSEEERTIFVDNISSECNEQTLYELFYLFGTVLRIDIRSHNQSIQSVYFGQLYAYITYEKRDSALNAFTMCQGKILCGNALK